MGSVVHGLSSLKLSEGPGLRAAANSLVSDCKLQASCTDNSNLKACSCKDLGPGTRPSPAECWPARHEAIANICPASVAAMLEEDFGLCGSGACREKYVFQHVSSSQLGTRMSRHREAARMAHRRRLALSLAAQRSYLPHQRRMSILENLRGARMQGGHGVATHRAQ